MSRLVDEAGHHVREVVAPLSDREVANPAPVSLETVLWIMEEVTTFEADSHVALAGKQGTNVSRDGVVEPHPTPPEIDPLLDVGNEGTDQVSQTKQQPTDAGGVIGEEPIDLRVGGRRLQGRYASIPSALSRARSSHHSRSSKLQTV